MNSCLLAWAVNLFKKDCFLNPIALRKAKIAYNFGLSECNRVKEKNLVQKKIRLNKNCLHTG